MIRTGADGHPQNRDEDEPKIFEEDNENYHKQFRDENFNSSSYTRHKPFYYKK